MKIRNYTNMIFFLTAKPTRTTFSRAGTPSCRKAR